MKLTFLGGADEVGASCTLIEIAGKKLLVDAGIRISPKSNRGIANDQLPDLQAITEIGGPDYILVTHAHTDHTGALALVMEQYPYTPVIMTRPTEALTRVLQKDALKIMSSNQEQEGELPLFDEISVNRLMDAIQLVEFNQPIKLGEGLQVTYHVAGHIAGAAMLVLESTEGTLVMSGDISRSPQRTVKSVEVPRIKADALVLESTYGGRLHANRVAEEKRLIQNLKRITERGGKVLIPAFALGRSQELVQIIHAFADELDVPVYVDGMVRSVCDAYARFADLLPEKTVRVAGGEHLFFRGRVKPVRSRDQRSVVATSFDPVIVIASSGMLTGGASVFYAKHFAPDERNAILLTGYQDEESPGRFMQNIMRKKEQGETPTLRLGNEQVKLRCEIDTYSLSAHGDESELISVAEAFGASQIMLVHGDEGARHSLATGLRQRQKVVITPRIGTTREFSFKEKPWAIGNLKAGSHTGDVDLARLWDSVKAQSGSYYSSRELAQVWWGDGNRAEAMKDRLSQQDNIYFAADWRNKSTFLIRTEEQVNRAQRQRAIMLANPDIVGKLIVLRNSNDQPRLGVVKSADIDSFDATVQNAKGTHYPADALLWIVGDWRGVDGVQGSMRTQLAALLKNARAHMDAIIPFSMRQHLVDNELTILPEQLLPDPEDMPDGVDQQTAITSIVLALAKDGATLEQDGLKPNRAREDGPLEQNEARELALSLFPEEANLRKVGMDMHRVRLLLSFDFPQAAERLYGDLIEDLIEQSGWDVQIKPQVNQQALSVALDNLLPTDAHITKGPSYYMDKRAVEAEVSGVDEDDIRDIESDYLRITDFKLSLSIKRDLEAPKIEDIQLKSGEKMEINQAYALVRNQLEPKGLYKAGLKHGKIVLTFITPQVGERHTDDIRNLSQVTGYKMDVHPHPNQAKMGEIMRRLAHEAGWNITKGPGIHIQDALISVSLLNEPDDATFERIADQLREATGYQLEVNF
ncbi:MAG: MBL fold metallo-hydrolase [Chloroflexota bacterium]